MTDGCLFSTSPFSVSVGRDLHDMNNGGVAGRIFLMIGLLASGRRRVFLPDGGCIPLRCLMFNSFFGPVLFPLFFIKTQLPQGPVTIMMGGLRVGGNDGFSFYYPTLSTSNPSFAF
jgi:hypothetical protein